MLIIRKASALEYRQKIPTNSSGLQKHAPGRKNPKDHKIVIQFEEKRKADVTSPLGILFKNVAP